MGESAEPSMLSEERGDVTSLTGSAPLGRRGFIAGTAAAAAAATLVSTSVSSPVAAASYNKYQALDPLRLCDTRPGSGRNFGFTRTGKVTRVKIAGRTINGVTVPANATAAVFTLVGLNRVARGNYLSAYPTGTAWPGTSSLNMPFLNAVIPNLVTVRLGSGSVDILANHAADVILDLAGVYVPSDSGREKEGRYQEISPRRVLDTRNTSGKPGRDSTVRVDLTSLIGPGGLDADAEAVSVNLTAAQVTAQGYLTAYPFGADEPETSSLNVRANENRAIGAMVTLGRDSNNRLGFNVFVKNGSHVIVDVAGFITGSAANTSSTGLFVPIDPTRLMDTRKGHGGKKRLWPGWTRAFEIPSTYRAEAGTAVINLTAVRTMDRGFFTVNAARTRSGRPTVSSLNVAGPNSTVANHVVSRVSTAGLEVYSDRGGDVVADMVGYYKATSLAGATQVAPADPAPPAIAPPYWMSIPSISRMNAGRSVVSAGDAKPVVDSGNIWHWAGTGYVGQGRYNVATFGHRTEAGGPLYFVDQLTVGDRIYMVTSDQRSYVYKYSRRELTSDSSSQILAATRRLSGESLSLVACTVGFDSSKAAYPNQWAATSLDYRIVVTCEFEYWTDDIPLQ